MEKEILKSKKLEIIKLKEELDGNAEKINLLEDENDQLMDEYKIISNDLDKIDKGIYKYEQLASTKKIAKYILLLSILGSLFVGCICYFGGTTNNILVSVLASTFSFGFSNMLGCYPYLIVKNSIKKITDLSFEELHIKYKEKDSEKKLNREKLGKNLKEIGSLNLRNCSLEDEIYMLSCTLLKDKEARDEIMEEILKEYPKEELIKTITDSMLEQSKIKVKK